MPNVGDIFIYGDRHQYIVLTLEVSPQLVGRILYSQFTNETGRVCHFHHEDKIKQTSKNNLMRILHGAEDYVQKNL